MKRKANQGLFNGYWLDMNGKKIRRIWRKEYGELYRLHRLCSEYEKQGVVGAGKLAEAPHCNTAVGLPGAGPLSPLRERNPFHEEAR